MNTNHSVKEWLIELIQEDFDNGDDGHRYLDEITTYGCQSGIVGELISTYDCKLFFDKFYYDIIEIVSEHEDETGEPLNHGNLDLRTFYAWFAVEAMAWNLLHEIESTA